MLLCFRNFVISINAVTGVRVSEEDDFRLHNRVPVYVYYYRGHHNIKIPQPYPTLGHAKDEQGTQITIDQDE